MLLLFIICYHYVNNDDDDRVPSYAYHHDCYGKFHWFFHEADETDGQPATEPADQEKEVTQGENEPGEEAAAVETAAADAGADAEPDENHGNGGEEDKEDGTKAEQEPNTADGDSGKDCSLSNEVHASWICMSMSVSMSMVG